MGFGIDGVYFLVMVFIDGMNAFRIRKLGVWDSGFGIGD
jgi:hypothetical protein